MNKIDTSPSPTSKAETEISAFCATLDSKTEFRCEHISVLADILVRYMPDIIDKAREMLVSGKSDLQIRLTGEKPKLLKNGISHSERLLASAILLGMTTAIGFNPYALAQERSGALVHDVHPEPGSENSVSSMGTVDFALHSDCACLERDIRPELLSLTCLVDETSTETKIAALSDVFKLLSTETIDVLASPNFIHKAPESFFGSIREHTGSILDRIDGQWEIKIATHNCQPLTPRAKRALQILVEQASKVSRPYRWSPGDLLMLNNRKCLHGRGPIINGNRHLLRCYGTRAHACGTVLNLDS